MSGHRAEPYRLTATALASRARWRPGQSGVLGCLPRARARGHHARMSDLGRSVPFADAARLGIEQLLAEDAHTRAGLDPVVDLDGWAWQDTLIVAFVIAAVADVSPEVAVTSLEAVTRPDAVEPYGVLDYLEDCLRAVDHAREQRLR